MGKKLMAGVLAVLLLFSNVLATTALAADHSVADGLADIKARDNTMPSDRTYAARIATRDSVIHNMDKLDTSVLVQDTPAEQLYWYLNKKVMTVDEVKAFEWSFILSQFARPFEDNLTDVLNSDIFLQSEEADLYISDNPDLTEGDARFERWGRSDADKKAIDAVEYRRVAEIIRGNTQTQEGGLSYLTLFSEDGSQLTLGKFIENFVDGSQVPVSTSNAQDTVNTAADAEDQKVQYVFDLGGQHLYYVRDKEYRTSSGESIDAKMELFQKRAEILKDPNSYPSVSIDKIVPVFCVSNITTNMFQLYMGVYLKKYGLTLDKDDESVKARYGNCTLYVDSYGNICMYDAGDSKFKMIYPNFLNPIFTNSSEGILNNAWETVDMYTANKEQLYLYNKLVGTAYTRQPRSGGAFLPGVRYYTNKGNSLYSTFLDSQYGRENSYRNLVVMLDPYDIDYYKESVDAPNTSTVGGWLSVIGSGLSSTGDFLGILFGGAQLASGSTGAYQATDHTQRNSAMIWNANLAENQNLGFYQPQVQWLGPNYARLPSRKFMELIDRTADGSWSSAAGSYLGLDVIVEQTVADQGWTAEYYERMFDVYNHSFVFAMNLTADQVIASRTSVYSQSSYYRATSVGFIEMDLVDWGRNAEDLFENEPGFFMPQLQHIFIGSENDLKQCTIVLSDAEGNDRYVHWDPLAKCDECGWVSKYIASSDYASCEHGVQAVEACDCGASYGIHSHGIAGYAWLQLEEEDRYPISRVRATDEWHPIVMPELADYAKDMGWTTTFFQKAGSAIDQTFNMFASLFGGNGIEINGQSSFMADSWFFFIRDNRISDRYELVPVEDFAIVSFVWRNYYIPKMWLRNLLEENPAIMNPYLAYVSENAYNPDNVAGESVGEMEGSGGSGTVTSDYTQSPYYDRIVFLPYDVGEQKMALYIDNSPMDEVMYGGTGMRLYASKWDIIMGINKNTDSASNSLSVVASNVSQKDVNSEEILAAGAELANNPVRAIANIFAGLCQIAHNLLAVGNNGTLFSVDWIVNEGLLAWVVRWYAVLAGFFVTGTIIVLLFRMIGNKELRFREYCWYVLRSIVVSTVPIIALSGILLLMNTVSDVHLADLKFYMALMKTNSEISYKQTADAVFDRKYYAFREQFTNVQDYYRELSVKIPVSASVITGEATYKDVGIKDWVEELRYRYQVWYTYEGFVPVHGDQYGETLFYYYYDYLRYEVLRYYSNNTDPQLTNVREMFTRFNTQSNTRLQDISNAEKIWAGSKSAYAFMLSDPEYVYGETITKAGKERYGGLEVQDLFGLAFLFNPDVTEANNGYSVLGQAQTQNSVYLNVYQNSPLLGKEPVMVAGFPQLGDYYKYNSEYIEILTRELSQGRHVRDRTYVTKTSLYNAFNADATYSERGVPAQTPLETRLNILNQRIFRGAQAIVNYRSGDIYDDAVLVQVAMYAAMETNKMFGDMGTLQPKLAPVTYDNNNIDLDKMLRLIYVKDMDAAVNHYPLMYIIAEDPWKGILCGFVVLVDVLGAVFVWTRVALLVSLFFLICAAVAYISIGLRRTIKKFMFGVGTQLLALLGTHFLLSFMMVTIVNMRKVMSNIFMEAIYTILIILIFYAFCRLNIYMLLTAFRNWKSLGGDLYAEALEARIDKFRGSRMGRALLDSNEVRNTGDILHSDPDDPDMGDAAGALLLAGGVGGALRVRDAIDNADRLLLTDGSGAAASGGADPVVIPDGAGGGSPALPTSSLAGASGGPSGTGEISGSVGVTSAEDSVNDKLAVGAKDGDTVVLSEPGEDPTGAAGPYSKLPDAESAANNKAIAGDGDGDTSRTSDQLIQEATEFKAESIVDGLSPKKRKEGTDIDVTSEFTEAGDSAPIETLKNVVADAEGKVEEVTERLSPLAPQNGRPSAEDLIKQANTLINGSGSTGPGAAEKDGNQKGKHGKASDGDLDRAGLSESDTGVEIDRTEADGATDSIEARADRNRAKEVNSAVERVRAAQEGGRKEPLEPAGKKVTADSVIQEAPGTELPAIEDDSALIE